MLVLAFAGGARADHSAVELVSTGSVDSNEQLGATFLGATTDGSAAFFLTAERLVPADANSSLDIYERRDGVTTLISIGPKGSGGVPPPGTDFFAWNGPEPHFGITPDGRHVLFETDQALVTTDTDSDIDIYERSGGLTTLVSTGAHAECPHPSGCDATFRGVSADGSRVFFETGEELALEDIDGLCEPEQDGPYPCYDVYERSNGTTRLLSIGPDGGNGGEFAFFAGASSDGAHVFFTTRESLVASDADGFALDVYERSGSTTSLVSAGPLSPAIELEPAFLGASENGERVFFTTPAQLVAEDVNASYDIYQRSAAGTELISSGLSRNGAVAGPFAATPDGTHVLFESFSWLAEGDGDDESDVYERSNATTRLVSTGPSGGNGPFGAQLGGISPDGSRTFFETAEKLTDDDHDIFNDVYERSAGTTRLISAGGTFGPGAHFLDVSADGARVFFETEESLVSGDSDSSNDVYESFEGKTTLVSRGGQPTPDVLDLRFGAASDDGRHVFFETSKRLVESDSDGATDVYAARVQSATERPTEVAIHRPAGPAAPDRVSPRLKLSLRRVHRLKRFTRRGIKLTATCDETCAIALELRLSSRGRLRDGTVTSSLLIARTTAHLPAGTTRSIRLHPRVSALRRLRIRRAVRMTLNVIATDAPGNRTTTTRTIRVTK